MTDIDIVAELRRLYEAAPQGKWRSEPDRRVGYRIYSPDEIERNHTTAEEPETADLIVAMHEALPALLDAVEALRWYADTGNYHDPTDVPDHLYRDSGDVLLIRGGGGQRARAALAALGRSDEE